MKPLSLSTRISLLFAIGAAVVLLALGWLVARSVEAHFLEIDRHELEGKLSLVRNLLAKAGTPRDLAAVPAQLDDALVGHHGLAVTLMAEDGTIWFASLNAELPNRLSSKPQSVSTWRVGERTWRGLSAPVVTNVPNGPRLTAAIALDITHHRQFTDNFLVMLGLATIMAMLATAGLGWLAARTGLTPLGRMTRLATRLSARELSERIPEAPLPTEIRTLATAFNAMLDRLEEAFARLTEFSSDIAHELRTPVSNLMTQTQVAMGRERTAEEYREVLQSCMEEYERLSRMIEEMLFLAKADNRLIIPNRESVDLTREMRDLMEFHGLVAEERGVNLELEGAATVSGDRLMLRRALSNLLSNAIRHCPDGQIVTIHLSQDHGAHISIGNPGEILAENLPRLFDRFYTGDPARRSGNGGVGLGLAIVRSIAQAHGGTATAQSGGGNVFFILHLPEPHRIP